MSPLISRRPSISEKTVKEVLVYCIILTKPTAAATCLGLGGGQRFVEVLGVALPAGAGSAGRAGDAGAGLVLLRGGARVVLLLGSEDGRLSSIRRSGFRAFILMVRTCNIYNNASHVCGIGSVSQIPIP